MAVHKYTRSDGSTVYRAQYFAPDGTRRSEHVRTIPAKGRKKDHDAAGAAAENRAHERRAEVENGTWVDPEAAVRDDRIPFRRLVERFLREYPPATGSAHWRNRSTAWVSYFKDRPAASITPHDVEGFRRHREAATFNGRRIGPTTVRKDLATLATLFRWARKSRLVRMEENPADPDLVKRPKEPPHRMEYLDREQEAALLAECPPWLWRIVVMAVHSGMDRAEIVGLTWQDVDLAGGRIFAPRAKTAEERTVQIGETLRAVLDQCREAQRIVAPGTRVFVGRHGEPVTPNGVNLALRRAYLRAGIPPVQIFKRLRRTFGTRLAEQGASEFEVMGALGHATPEMARRYVRLADARRRELVDRLPGPAALPAALHTPLHKPRKAASGGRKRPS